MAIGEQLVAMRMITPVQLAYAVAEQPKWGRRLGQLVTELKFCSERQLLDALAQQAHLPAIDLDAATPSAEALARLPKEMMLEHRVVPLRLSGPRDSVLEVAIAAPALISSLDAVREAAKVRRVVASLALDRAVDAWLDKLGLGLPSSDDAFELEVERTSDRAVSREADGEPITLGWGGEPT